MSKKCFRQSVTCKFHCTADNLNPTPSTTSQIDCLDADPNQRGLIWSGRSLSRLLQAGHILHSATDRSPTGFRLRLSCDNSSTDLLQVWRSIGKSLQGTGLQRQGRADLAPDHACRLTNTVVPHFDTVSGQSRSIRAGQTRPIANDRFPLHASGRRYLDRAGRARNVDRIESARPALTQVIKICPCTWTLKRDTHHAIA